MAHQDDGESRMTIADRLRSARPLMALALSAILLGACGSDKPEALIASARQFIAGRDYQAAWIQLKNVVEKQPENGEAHYLMGLALNGYGDFRSAEGALRRALERGQSPALVHPLLAGAILGQRDFQRVIREYGDSKLDDRAAQAQVEAIIGEALLALGRRGEAAQAFAAALASAPANSRARVGMARIRAMEGDTAEAEKLVDAVLSTTGEDGAALGLKADLLLARGRRDEAVGILTRLVELSPRDRRARASLVSNLVAGGKFAQAETQINAWKKAHPKDVHARYFEAVLAYGNHEYGKARDALLQVFKSAPKDAPSLLLAGAVEYQLRSYSAAQDYLRQVLTGFPDNLDARKLLAATFLRLGQPARAEEALAPALKTAPKDPAVLRVAGEVALANNKLEDAGRYFDQALSTAGDDAPLRTRRAQIRLAQGDTERALDELGAASALDQSDYQADLSLAVAHFGRREFDKALAAAGTFERKQPSNPNAPYMKGVILAAMDRTSDARASFEKALSLQSSHLPAAGRLALLDLADLKPEAATKRLTEILAKEPNNEEALRLLARTMRLTGAGRKDIGEVLERAVRANPGSVGARLAMIDFLARGGDPDAARAAAREANVAIPRNAAILEALGRAYLALGETSQAITTFNELATVQPDSTHPLIQLASAHFAARRIDASLSVLRKALALKPGDPDVLRNMIAVLLAAGRADAAQKEALAAQKSWPKETIGFVMEGEVHAARKRPAEAARAYANAAQVRPAPGLIVRQHQLLRAANEPDAADSVAATWLKSNAKDVVVRYYLAGLALQRKDYPAAIALYREILALQPDHAAALNDLAWVLGETKDPAALGTAKKAYAKAPENPYIMETYGWLLYNSGDTQRGITLMKHATRIIPAVPEGRMHLGKALLASGDKAGARRELEAVAKSRGDSPLKAEAERLLKSL